MRLPYQSPVLSSGTTGCNLGCWFCQNWDISASRETGTLADEAAPGAIARAAQLGCRSMAFRLRVHMPFKRITARPGYLEHCHE
jgi:uncharacterized Fe-S radical SAM superfamily protein PflX